MSEVYARTRSEHLEWCKNRAYRYLKAGDLVAAVASMVSDLEKHESFRSGANSYLLLLGGMYATDGDREGVRRWIEGFR
jgi:hypothetical protein